MVGVRDVHDLAPPAIGSRPLGCARGRHHRVGTVLQAASGSKQRCPNFQAVRQGSALDQLAPIRSHRGLVHRRAQLGRAAHEVVIGEGGEILVAHARRLERRVSTPEVAVGLRRLEAHSEAGDRRAEKGVEEGLGIDGVGPRQRKAAVDQDGAPHTGGPLGSEAGRHVGAHRVTGHHGSLDAEVVEHGQHVGSVGVDTERSRHVAALAPSTEIERHELSARSELTGHWQPRAAVRGDPVGGDHVPSVLVARAEAERGEGPAFNRHVDPGHGQHSLEP